MPIRARKRFGQHFLEPAWADRLVAAIEPAAGDRFVEIGPGPGALTLRLAPRVAHVTAVEIDRDLAAELAPQVPPNVEIVEADFLEADLAAWVLPGPVRVAGNLPYYITTPILFRLVEGYRRHGTIRDATLMVQEEVAERLTAAPGGREYGVLTISVGLHADVRRLLTLPAGAFRPRPKVTSAVVRVTFRPPQVAVGDEATFTGMVKAMFSQRRKTLGNALAPFAGSRGLDARQALGAAGIDPSRRPETLQLVELSRLADALGGRSDAN